MWNSVNQEEERGTRAKWARLHHSTAVMSVERRRADVQDTNENTTHCQKPHCQNLHIARNLKAQSAMSNITRWKMEDKMEDTSLTST